MNFSFLAGVFTAWLAFTPEGQKMGNNLTTKCMKYIRENYLMEKKNGDKRINREDENCDRRAE